MDLGRPPIFTEYDSPKQLADNLTVAMRSIWELLRQISNSIPAASVAESGNVHTSAMPDMAGVNGDHDRRYYRKSQVDSLVTDATNQKSVCINVFDSDKAVATGDGTTAFSVPDEIDGWNLIDVLATVHDKGVTGTTDIMIHRRRTGTNADMLTTKVTIGDEYFARDEDVDESNDDVATGDRLYIDVDAVHSGTAPNGLSVTLTFQEVTG